MALKAILRWVIMWNNIIILTQVIPFEYLPRAANTQALTTRECFRG